MNLLATPKLRYSKQIVNRILGKTKKWVIQGGVLVPFTAVIPAQSFTYILKKRWPPLSASKVVSICTNHGSKSYWLFDEDECTKLGWWCITHPSYIAKIYKQWKIDKKKYYAILQKMSLKGIQAPLKDFGQFYKAYINEYSAPLVQEYYSLASNEYIHKLISKYGRSTKLQKEINILTLPTKLSFLQSAELAVTELALQLVKRKLPKKFAQFRQQYPSLYDKLSKVQQEFFCIHFNYRDTNPHSLLFFYHQAHKLVMRKKLEELKRRYDELKMYEKNVKKQQKAVITKSKFTRDEIRVLKSMGFITHWQDERKKANLLGNYWCNIFLLKIAEKGKYSMDELRHLLPSEFASLLKGGWISKQELKKRLKGSLYFVFVSGQEGIITGTPYKKLWNYLKQMNHPGRVKELRGIAASAGKYRGRVRIIETAALDGKKMKQGEILVTYMTRPDFVPLMHKAGAIVTDEGGLTSHAAIVSRELGVPCVVGTRFAMRILKDGDRIEVDANKGIIRKL